MADPITVSVELGNRSYPIFIGSDLLTERELFTPYIKGSQVCIISNDVVAPLYLEKLKAVLTGFELKEFINIIKKPPKKTK